MLNKAWKLQYMNRRLSTHDPGVYQQFLQGIYVISKSNQLFAQV